MTAVAFANNPKRKAKYLNRARQHRESDEIVQCYGYWKDGKGCGIGCLAHTDHNPHTKLAKAWHCDVRLFHLADAIFEGLPSNLAKQWPEHFTAAIQPGSDQSLTWPRFAAWLLTESELLTITDDNRGVIEGVAELYGRVVNGECVADCEWEAAATATEAATAAMAAAKAAAWSSAWAARAAARSASWAAAWSASWAAAWAAIAARESAAAARESAKSAESAESAAAAAESAYQKMSDKFIELLWSAPVVGETAIKENP